MTAPGGTLPTVEDLERDFFERQLAELEARRDRRFVKDLERGDRDAKTRAALDSVHQLQLSAKAAAWGALTSEAFVRWVRTGEPLTIPGPGGTETKANLVEDATGETLVPTPITLDIVNIARTVGMIRPLADVRPTTQSKVTVGLLGAAATGWGKLETGTTATDAGIVPSAAAPNPIPVYDLCSLALVGVDELADAPVSVAQSITEAVGVAIADAEDAAFANGTGSGQPSGLALAANVALVPGAQKVAVSVSNTPTVPQLESLPWLLPSRFRANATWLMHPTSASKVSQLEDTGGVRIWPEPGPNGKGLFGWPVAVVDGLPDPATAGTTDASIWFADVRSAYRVVDRQRTTVQVLRQRYADQGIIGLIVRHRVGADMVRGSACVIYTQ
jgi:HK97 family phage major capsid protein